MRLAVRRMVEEALARVLRGDVVERYQKAYPMAVRCFLEDLEACTAHLSCPASLRKVIRTANLLERLFEEERRHTKTIASSFGERPVLKLMYAPVIRASDTCRGVRTAALGRGQLERLREQLIEKHRHTTEAAKEGSTPPSFTARLGRHPTGRWSYR